MLSVIVAADRAHARLHHAIEAMVGALAGSNFELIVASREPLSDMPDGVRVVVYDSAARGDRLDRAAEVARGDLLAFIDDRVRLPRTWAPHIEGLFGDPDVCIAGGPVLPRSWRRSEQVSAVMLEKHLGLTPGSHVSRTERARPVRELAGANLVVRAATFRDVGGFQSPSVGGEAVRLCFKVRSILQKPVLYDPGLAVSATVLRFPRSFLATVTAYGKTRGDLARRLPETSPLVPYALPTVLLLLLGLELGLLPLRWWLAAEVGVVALGVIYLTQAAVVMTAQARLSDRLIASLCLPIVPLSYGVGFVRGFLGPSLSEISPRTTRKRNLRVLIMNWRDVTHPWAGGAEAYVHEIGRRWAAQGMDVGWLTQRHPGSSRHDTIDGIRVYRVGRRFTLYPCALLVYMTRLRKRYDVIIDCENGIPFFSPLVARKPVVLLVHHVHTQILRTQLRPPLRWLGLWLEGRLVPRVYHRTRVVAVSQSTREDLVRMGVDSDNITVVHNGVRLPERTARHESEHPTIVCAGRLKPQKTIDVLIRAAAELRPRFPALRLEIVGQGPERTRLERLAWSLGLANNVRFHGYLPDAARDDVASRAWVAVCPSSFEGWGVVCMEASARELAVVAADVPGLRDSVLDGQTGVLVPHGDSRALAEQLDLLFRDKARRDALGAAGRTWAAKHTWDRSADEMLAVIAATMPHGEHRIATPHSLPSNREPVREELQPANAG